MMRRHDKAKILASKPWQQISAAYQQWLESQAIYTPADIKRINAQVSAEIQAMPVSDLQEYIDDWQAKLKVLNGKDFQEAQKVVGILPAALHGWLSGENAEANGADRRGADERGGFGERDFEDSRGSVGDGSKPGGVRAEPATAGADRCNNRKRLRDRRFRKPVQGLIIAARLDSTRYKALIVRRNTIRRLRRTCSFM